MSDKQINDALNEQIKAAKPEKLDTSSLKSEGKDSFGDIVADVISGETSTEEVEERVVDWANRQVDVPLIPESVEEQAIQVLKDLLIQAVVEAAQSLVK